MNIYLEFSVFLVERFTFRVSVLSYIVYCIMAYCTLSPCSRDHMSDTGSTVVRS